MDTSKEYIKMCKKAEEIQKQWKPEVADFIIIRGRQKPSFIKDLRIRHTTICIFGEPLTFTKALIIWLPRQDQLQEMVKRDIWFETIYRFYRWLGKDKWNPDRWESIFGKFNSMEQLWLAFVMKEKYSKQWLTDKQEWVKI